jgi:hypothetical protein
MRKLKASLINAFWASFGLWALKVWAMEMRYQRASVKRLLRDTGKYPKPIFVS